MMSNSQQDLWRIRLYYVVWFGGNGFAMPFLTLFYLHLGLTGAQIGWVTAMGALVTLLAAPFWTSQHERWPNPRLALQLFLVLEALGYFLISQQVFFLGVLAAVIFRAGFAAGIWPLSDALALRVAKAAASGYGGVRVFGSLGWVIFVLLSGWVVEWSGLQASLIGASLLTLLSAPLLWHIRAEHFAAEPATETERPRLWQVLHRNLSQPMMLGTAMMVVVLGMTNSGVVQFQSTYLRELGARDSVIGIAWMLSAAVELPCMFWADHLMKTHSPYRLLLIAMLMFVAMRGLVFLFPSVAMILLTTAGGGISFSFYTIALVRFIAEQTLPQETRTILAFYIVTLVNITAIVSAPLAGMFYDEFGAHGFYAMAALGYFLAWISLQVAGRVQELRLMAKPR